MALAAPSARLSIVALVHERVSRSGGRGKKVAIVALARKLLIALWKYAVSGVVIEGAVMTAA
jgi:transposase